MLHFKRNNYVQPFISVFQTSQSLPTIIVVALVHFGDPLGENQYIVEKIPQKSFVSKCQQEQTLFKRSAAGFDKVFVV